MPFGKAAPAWPWRLIALVAALTVIRLAVGGALHLTEDEAYYRLWSMVPALGYYDHPPMIAWWIALGRALLGDTPLAVRLPPILGAAAASGLVWDLARRAGAGARAAERAGIWFNATLLVAAGGFLAVPDAPASLFWVLTLWLAQRATQAGRGAVIWWLGAGLAAGLATLSKYSALFLGPGLLIWLLWTPAGRGRLRTPGPWLALGVAAGVFSLNVGWNATHHWLTFIKQFGRVAPGRWAPRYLAEFLISQGLLLNPLIAVFAIKAMRRGATPSFDKALFVAASAPFIAYLLIHGLHDRVQAHWPAPIYPAIAILAAVAAEGARSSGWRALRKATPWVGLAVMAALLVYLAASNRFLRGAPDLAAPVRGWRAFAARIEAVRRAQGDRWVGAVSYGLAAQLLDEPSLKAPTLQISERDRWLDLGPAPDLARPGLIIDLPRRLTSARLGRCFAEVAPLGHLTRGGTDYAVFSVSRPRFDIAARGC